MALDLYAGISVGDYARALDWYERLLGAPPDLIAGPTEAVWDLAEHRSVFIVHRPEHAGHSRHTIFVGAVPELEAWVARIADRGIEPAEWEDYPDGMREALFRDPEGNEIWFGGAPTGAENAA
ncbi:VOC family protein [Kocuria arenosa]|uniref:VOC family protein n=1 Tax=Kocuria arenosa TaxID=3071446 RepID=UPI0034D757EC